jgi:hypothetical protein
MKEINIAEILRDKPRGTKLYSMIHGKCSFEAVTDEIFKINFCTSKFGLTQSGECTLIKFGNMFDGGECIIFPSKEMRNWYKFGWKKGDVLVGVGQRVIFEKFIDENYTKFQGKYSLSTYEDRTLVIDRSYYTSNFSKINDRGNVENYFEDLEEKLDGKLNRQTLEVEKTQPEFKDGDILYATDGISGIIYINKKPQKNIDICYCYKPIGGSNLHICNLENSYDCTLPSNTIIESKTRFATEEEKQHLFNALAKEGKAWDAGKKEVVDLKPKCEFKPMDLCLMKYIGKYNNRGWELCQYAYTEHRVSSSGEQRDFYHAVGGEIYAECIPYKGNEHLLGTKKNLNKI